jgi:hypothetical protein
VDDARLPHHPSLERVVFRPGAAAGCAGASAFVRLPPRAQPAAIREVARVLTPGGILYSRSFRPRPEEWLRLMPFQAHSFGIEPGQMLSLMSPHFEASFWREVPDMYYVVARRKPGACQY